LRTFRRDIAAVFERDPAARIGANAVVVKSVPSNAVVVGVPGQIIARSKPHSAKDRLDLEHSVLPDLVGVTLQSLLARVEELERRAEDSAPADVHRPTEGIWHGEGFAIEHDATKDPAADSSDPFVSV